MPPGSSSYWGSRSVFQPAAAAPAVRPADHPTLRLTVSRSSRTVPQKRPAAGRRRSHPFHPGVSFNGRLASHLNIPSKAISATTATTFAGLTTPSNQRVKVLGYGFYFDGTVNTNQPVEIKLARPTSVTLTTGGTAILEEPGFAETVQTTTALAASGEPTLTASLVYKTLTVHPQLGYEYLAPLGQELQLAGGTKWVASINAPKRSTSAAT